MTKSCQLCVGYVLMGNSPFFTPSPPLLHIQGKSGKSSACLPREFISPFFSFFPFLSRLDFISQKKEKDGWIDAERKCLKEEKEDKLTG